MKNIIICLNVGVLLLFMVMFILKLNIKIIGGADGITDVLIPSALVFSMIYILFVIITNIYWFWTKC